ncbi:hypothetical protein [Bradyrhizobium campsiandrae]|uniref:hypothetical protein n=1 Tax=Bradyrhizobium campsiandrae TaxID=1729892 RepID=UPI001FCE6040|nr:hypothetical protein [Bradyrhizobium campsiandrae]
MLDLLEPAVWVGFHSRSDIHLIGPALTAYFGLCGATPVEATRATRGDFRPSGSDRILLPGLIKGVQPRFVPLVAIAKLRLQAYVSVTSYTSDADALFKDTNDAPIGLESIYGNFSQLGYRIGLSGGELPRVLREAFLRWLDHCPNEDTRSYLSGKSLFGAQFSTAPGFRESKAALELALEPLAKLDRQGLRQGGAVARNFPSPYFPTLSRDGLSDLAAVQNGSGTLPLEVLRAIQIALRSGKSMLEVSDHYRLSRTTIYRYVRNGFPHERIPTLTNPSTGRAIARYVQSNPQCYSTELTAWVNVTFGTNASRSYVSRLTKNLGLKLAPHPYWSIQKEAVDQSWGLVKAAIQHDPMLSNSEIVEIIENETGIALGLTNIAKHLSRRRDLPPRAKRRGQQFRGPGNEWSFSETFERIWPTLRQEMLRDPSLADRELCDIIEGETGTRLSLAMCQSACKFDPSSASNFDPFGRRALLVALVSSELAGIAEARRARVM